MHRTKMQKSRISQIEWGIRKTERGIKVLHAQGADHQKILEYGQKREDLKDELEKLTVEKYFSSGRWKILKEGRRIPNSPEWPL